MVIVILSVNNNHCYYYYLQLCSSCAKGWNFADEAECSLICKATKVVDVFIVLLSKTIHYPLFINTCHISTRKLEWERLWRSQKPQDYSPLKSAIFLPGEITSIWEVIVHFSKCKANTIHVGKEFVSLKILKAKGFSVTWSAVKDLSISP